MITLFIKVTQFSKFESFEYTTSPADLRYEIQEGRLFCYDRTRREVEIIVNEKHNLGNYEFCFTATNLAMAFVFIN